MSSRYLSKDLNQVADDIVVWRKSKGFSTPESIEHSWHAEAMLGKLMLVVSEIGEAAEAVRDLDTEHFTEEVADAFIRLLDICGTMKIDISKAIQTKMIVNESRPNKHSRKITL